MTGEVPAVSLNCVDHGLSMVLDSLLTFYCEDFFPLLAGTCLLLGRVQPISILDLIREMLS